MAQKSTPPKNTSQKSKKNSARTKNNSNNTNKKSSFLPLFLFAFLAFTVCNYFFSGVGLNGLPSERNIASVEITDTAYPGVVVNLTSEDDISNARNLGAMLHFHFGDAAELTPPHITIRYHLKDAQTQTLEVSEDQVVWNGEAYPLLHNKQNEMFFTLVNGLYFEPPTPDADD